MLLQDHAKTASCLASLASHTLQMLQGSSLHRADEIVLHPLQHALEACREPDPSPQDYRRLCTEMQTLVFSILKAVRKWHEQSKQQQSAPEFELVIHPDASARLEVSCFCHESMCTVYGLGSLLIPVVSMRSYYMPRTLQLLSLSSPSAHTRPCSPS